MVVAIVLLLAFGGSSYAAGRRLPTAWVFNSTSQSISNSSPTTLLFNSEDYDVGDLHSTSIDTSCLTASMDGIYAISATVDWDSNSTGWRFAPLPSDPRISSRRWFRPSMAVIQFRMWSRSTSFSRAIASRLMSSRTREAP